MRKVLTVLLGGMLMVATSHAKITPSIFRLSNGLEVWVVERHVLPFAVFKLMVPAGSVFDPEEKAGLANLVVEMIGEGAKGLSAYEISREFEFMGADFDADCNKDYAVFTLKTTKRYMDRALKLFAKVLLEPTFPDKEFVRVKTEVMGEILKDQEDPGVVASEKFNEVVYGKGHPYHRPVKGYMETVKAISRDEVVEFYKTHYLPEGSKLIVVGDVDKERIKQELESLFGKWLGKAPGYPEVKPPSYHPGTFVVKKDVAQANIVIGHIGVSRSNPDFVKLYVANQILGGSGLTSRLFDRIREKGGYSYAVYSYFTPAFYQGTFRIVLQTKNDRAEDAVKEVLDEVKKFVENGPTQQELDDAKRYLTGSFPLRIDTNDEIAAYLVFVAFHNLGADYLNEFPSMIEKVTLQDVKEVIKKYIHPDKFTIVEVKKETR